MRSLIAHASMALKNWNVTGSIGGAQVLTLPRHFLGCFFRRNHARIHRDSFPNSTGEASLQRVQRRQQPPLHQDRNNALRGFFRIAVVQRHDHVRRLGWPFRGLPVPGAVNAALVALLA